MESISSLIIKERKEYYYNREALFDAEFLNPKRNGKVEEYDYFGNSKIFEG